VAHKLFYVHASPIRKFADGT